MTAEGKKILGSFKKGGSWILITIMASCARVHVRTDTWKPVFIRHDRMPSEKDIAKTLPEFQGPNHRN